MSDVTFKSDPEIENLLGQKRDIEKQIEVILNKRPGIRFSRKKFVADLGEHYFYINAVDLFKSLKQSFESNSDSDFIGVFKDEFAEQFGFERNSEQRIEVKTRYDQKGANQLFGLKIEKFDILAFVSISDDYKCYYVGMLRSSDIIPDNQKRIVFSKLKDKIFWPDNSYLEL